MLDAVFEATLSWLEKITVSVCRHIHGRFQKNMRYFSAILQFLGL